MAGKFFPPRRWHGLLCLVLGGAMLLWGQTVLQSRLTGKAFILYWTLCFFVTGMALVLSLWETRRLRQKLRQEEKALFLEMVRHIEQARQNREDSDSTAQASSSSANRTAKPPDSSAA